MVNLRVHLIGMGVLWWAMTGLASPMHSYADDDDDPPTGDVANDPTDASDEPTSDTGDTKGAKGTVNAGGKGKSKGKSRRKASNLLGGASVQASQEMPWSKGIAMDDRRKARELFVKGNERAKASLFATAEALYSEAIELWPHPAFYFNRAIVQLQLSKNLDAYESLKKALQYENAPLGVKNREEAEAQMRWLESRLTRVVITCDVPGAKVTLNGSDLFTGPGRYEGIKEPGMYQIIAEKPDHLADSREILFMAGSEREVDLKLRYKTVERRLSLWVPIAAAGLGASLAATGGLLQWKARGVIRDYDDLVSADCIMMTVGCAADEEDGTPVYSDKRERGERLAAWSKRVYVAGGVVFMTAAALAYFGRPAEVIRLAPGSPRAVAIEPIVTPKSASVSATITF